MRRRRVTLTMAVMSLMVSTRSPTDARAQGAGRLASVVRRWMQPQEWQRDTDGPIVSLGAKGAWDDTHLFAPCVAHEGGEYRLWYCGSTGTVAKRVFQLGLATSDDGRQFAKWPSNPVCSFGDGKRSVLTPTLLRSRDGEVLRENGKLRMWFAATDFSAGSLHQLHEATSEDGVNWSPPSAPQLDNVYAPTIIKEGDTYRMWFIDVGVEPWIIRHANSRDGAQWKVTDGPAVVVDQAWERERLFYPTVLRCDGAYLMWYGSYWTGKPNTTALGFAISEDGLTWHKQPDNPVLRPDPGRPWESHYTTSQSVRRSPDGSFRMWYASRTKPPFVNKYFAICTARWEGPR